MISSIYQSIHSTIDGPTIISDGNLGQQWAQLFTNCLIEIRDSEGARLLTKIWGQDIGLPPGGALYLL